MTRSRPITFLASAAVIPLVALTVAACGGGGAATAAPAAASSTSTTTTTPTTTPPKPVSVRIAKTSLGSILVNSRGRTLYLFKADVGTKSACTGACAVAWPPLLATGKPIAGKGLTASKLGTTTRSGGTRQVTYNGHPLYLFIKDTKPGDVKGQGLTAFGAAWFAVSPAGNQISNQTTGHSGSSSSQRSPAPAAPPAAPPAAKPQPAPQPTPKPAPPVAKPAPPANNGIPQNNGGDQDSDNNGGPSDGDGGI